MRTCLITFPGDNHEPHPYLTPTQWLPKPVTSQAPSIPPALRAPWSPPSEGAEREKRSRFQSMREIILGILPPPRGEGEDSRRTNLPTVIGNWYQFLGVQAAS